MSKETKQIAEDYIRTFAERKNIDAMKAFVSLGLDGFERIEEQLSKMLDDEDLEPKVTMGIAGFLYK